MSKTIAEQIAENEALQNKYKNNPNEYFFGTSIVTGKPVPKIILAIP